MGKTILVTGKEGFLGNELTQHFLNQGCRVAASVPSRQEARPHLDPGGNLLQFPWSRRSAVASKNFLLQTLQAFDTLDEAWILVTPEREAFGLADLAPLALDEHLDAAVKGTLYLVRELLQYQATHPAFVLRFVFWDEDPANLSPLAALQYQGLRGLVDTLLAQARKRRTPVWAYESLVPRAEEYLAFLTSGSGTDAGRWNVLGERKTLFQSFFARKDPPLHKERP